MKNLFLFFTIIILADYSAMAQITSVQSGNWGSTSTWDGGVVPTAADNVIIADGHTVTINGATSAFECNNLTIGQGTSGVLNYAADVSSSTSLTVNGDLILSAHSQYINGSMPTVEPGLYLKGNILVGDSAKLDHGSGSSKGVKTTFIRTSAGDQTINKIGAPVIIQFNKIVVDRPNITDRVLCSTTIYTKGGNFALLLTKGTFEQNAGTFIDTAATTANLNLGTANGIFKVTGSGSFWCTSSIVGYNGSNGSDAAIYINTSGTFTVGAKNSQARLQNSNTLDILNGTVNIFGRFTISNVANISGGNINIDPQGPVGSPLANTSHPFEVTSIGTLNMSGGVVTLVDPIQATGTGNDVKFSTSAVYNISGGTIRIGDGVSTTAGADGFQINTHTVTLWNLEINANNTSASRMVTLTDGAASPSARHLTVKNNLVINTGTVNANVATTGSNIYLGGTFSNSGTLNLGNASTFIYNGTSAQTTSGLPSPVPNLSFINTAGITVTSPVTVTGMLTLGGNGVYSNLNNISGYNGLTYSATVPQTTGSELSTTITNLTINNPNGVTLNSPTLVTGTFTLTSANSVLNTSAANLLTLSETSALGTVLGFVNGPMEKITNSTAEFTFPIGKNTKKMSLGIIPSNGNITHYQAEYFNSGWSGFSVLDTPFTRINNVDYFELSRTNGTADAIVRLYWDNSHNVKNINNIRVARNSITNWINEGADSVTGNTSSGSVYSKMVSSFSPFTLGFADPTVYLMALIEGLYDSGSMLMTPDTVKVFLCENTSPYTAIDSLSGLLDISGSGVFSFPQRSLGTNYYLKITHRNGLETWSALPITFDQSNKFYDLSLSSAQAYGGNLVQKGSKWCIFSGDVNHDGQISLDDLLLIDTDNQNFETGYLATDVNGDGQVTLDDLLITDSNNQNFVSVQKP